ncbi:DsbA family protein [Nordella sp. HKS 07]|uniref:DsbA family protein n=1 Tax=Nordella sp. HKS 07 TaxID=2712222 RepID=UPI0013E105B4|nr:DsbA family protein [Nordella sp. HKS 07]QIG50744.1 DsbA family protein [Nordella sp. HKS 07]
MLMTIRAILIAMIALFVLPAQAAEFNDVQKKELGDIVRQYLMENPEVVRDAMQELERKQQEAENAARTDSLKAMSPEIFRSKDDLIGGNPNGKVTVVEFFDYNCGYCKRAFPDVMKMIENDKDLKLVMKEFPILGPGSVYAARAALASRKQGKYWEYHMAMMAHEGRIDESVADQIAKATGLDVKKLKADMAADEVNQVIARNMQLADTLNIQGTPAFIIDETVIPGAVGYEALASVVKQVRDNGGCKLC